MANSKVGERIGRGQAERITRRTHGESRIEKRKGIQGKAMKSEPKKGI